MSNASCCVADGDWLLLLNDEIVPVALQQDNADGGLTDALVKFCRTFATSPRIRTAIQLLMKEGAIKPAQTILGEVVNGSPFAQVWLTYFQFLENQKKKVTGELVQRALKAAAWDPCSGALWRRRIQAVDQTKVADVTAEKRAIYQQAVVLPLWDVDTLWREYRQFEEELASGSEVVLDEVLQERHAFASDLVQQYQSFGVDISFLPRPPLTPAGKTNALEEVEIQASQYASWKESIALLLTQLGFLDGVADEQGPSSETVPPNPRENANRTPVPVRRKRAPPSEEGLLWLENHLKRFVSFFAYFDTAWVDYAMILCRLHPSHSVGVESALQVLERGQKYCPSSALLPIAKVELRVYVSQSNSIKLSKPLPSVALSDLEQVQASSGNHRAALQAFAHAPALVRAHKKEFRTIGKNATSQGVEQWSFYQLWLNIEHFILQDETLIKEIYKRGTKKMSRGSIEEALSVVSSQAFAAAKGEESNLLLLLEAAVQPLSSAPLLQSSGNAAKLAPTLGIGEGYNTLAGYRRSCWERFYHYERELNGTQSARRLQQISRRATQDLDVGAYHTPTTSNKVLQYVRDYSVGLHAPLDCESVGLQLRLEAIADCRKRKELEDRGDFISPMLSQNLDFVSPCYPPAVICTPSPWSRPAVSDGSSSESAAGWKPFTLPDRNPNPPLPSDDPHSAIPCGLRTLRGTLNRKLQLDYAATKRQQRDEEERQREKEDELARRSRFDALGIPNQLGQFIDGMPTLDDLREHAAVYSASSATISGVRLMDNVNHCWLVNLLRERPLDLEAL